MQSNTNGISGADVLESSFANLGLTNLLADTHQNTNTPSPSQLSNNLFMAFQCDNVKTNDPFETNDCSFFDPTKIINSNDRDYTNKFPIIDFSSFDFDYGGVSWDKIIEPSQSNEDLTSIKKSISPLDSPSHEFSCSLSSSSDSGCRSNSFSVDEDSGIHSLYSKASNITVSKLKEHNLQMDKLKNIKENIDANDDNLSQNGDEDDIDVDNDEDDDCDTSVDASDIPSDTDSLADLDLDENFLFDEPNEEVIIDKYIQILENDGTVARKKLDYGIYCSVNETRTLFIEPNDILKQMKNDEYEEYNLFPSRPDTTESQLVKVILGLASA